MDEPKIVFIEEKQNLKLDIDLPERVMQKTLTTQLNTVEEGFNGLTATMEESGEVQLRNYEIEEQERKLEDEKNAENARRVFWIVACLFAAAIICVHLSKHLK